MPNDAIVANLQTSYPKEKRWRDFRNDPNYIYVLQWIAQCRGYVKLALEHFDVDLFEMELFALVQPPPIDDLALLSNRLRLALLLKIHGKKIPLLGLFEPLFRVYFGSETPLKGPNEEEETDFAAADWPLFDDLFIDEKFQVLALLILEVSMYQDFREFIDKNKLSAAVLRPESVFREAKGASVEEYIVVFDGTACYKRTTKTVELQVPKKRSLAPADPDEALGARPFDVSVVNYEAVFRNIYQLDAFITELSGKKNKKNKTLLDVVKKPDFVENLFTFETKKRRIIHHRRKESEMARLLATRKRSSRLEAKEKQRYHEEQERKAQELEDLQYAVMRRSSHRTRNRFTDPVPMDYTGGITREERLKKRLEGTPDVSEEPLGSTEPTEVEPEVKNEAEQDIGSGSPQETEDVIETPQETPQEAEDIMEIDGPGKPQPNSNFQEVQQVQETLTGSLAGSLAPFTLPETMPSPKLAEASRETSEGPNRPNPTPKGEGQSIVSSFPATPTPAAALLVSVANGIDDLETVPE